MKKNKILGLIIILLLSFFSYVWYQAYTGELQFKTVLSGSMSPAINAGDVVLISKTNPEEIKEGDIITFREGKTFITHRVIEIVNNSFRTKGDANEDPDMKIIKTEQIVGKVIFVIPFLGYLGYFVRTPLGFLIFILIPGFLLIYSEIKKIRQIIKAKPKYEIDRMEKEFIIQKLRKELSSYNRNIKRSLCIYFICAFLLIFLVSPYYTGAFFKDIELSEGNILQAGTWIPPDTTPPITTATGIKEDGTNYTFGEWTNSDYINIILSCDDDSGASCNTSLYCTDQNNSCAPYLIYNGTPIQISTNGISYIRFRSNDTAGNLEETKNKTIKIDTFVPEATVDTPFFSKSKTFQLNFTYNDSIGEMEHIELWYIGFNLSTYAYYSDFESKDINKLEISKYKNYKNYTELSADFESEYDRGIYFFYALGVDKAGNREMPLNTLPKFESITIVWNASFYNHYGSNNDNVDSGGESGEDESNGTGNTITFSINLTFPENNSCTNKNTTEFNFTVSGTEQNYICELFLKNQSGNWINYGNTSARNNTVTTITPNQSFENLSEGIYNWMINCTANQTTNSSETRILTIDRTAPIVNLLNSSFSTNEAQPKIYFNFIDDLSNKASCVLYFNNSEVGSNNSATENTTTFIIPNSAQDDGNYTVYVNCTDLAGNTNKSLEINVSIDAPPTTTATGIKEDGTNYTFGEWTNSSYINVTLNCSATDCNTTLYCTDANNSCEPNLTGTQIQISAEGITYLRFRSNDTAGNNESVKNKTIKIDRTKPLIQINSPISNSTFNSNLIEINLTVTEDNLNYTNISVYNSTGDLVNSTTDNRTGNYIINLSVPDGIYNITAISFDLAGNKNSTTIENITVDATPPEISDWNINNTSVPVNSSVKLNATITDFIGIDTVKFFIEPFGNLTVNKNGDEYFIICNSTNPCNTMQAGVYNWTKIWANDTLGNYVSANISLQFNITN